MTNMSLKNHQGAATLLISVILVSVITLIILFAASYGLMQQKITANSYRNLQAYEAAEAGLEFAIPYLRLNESVILANPVSGFIPVYSNSSTQNVTLANNSKYTIVYSNPVANNYNLIKITSTGTSDDGTSVRVVSQLVQRGGFIATNPNSALISKGSVAMGGSATITNTQGGSTIASGSSVTFQGSSSTVTSSGISSTSALIKSDVQLNNSALANTSDENLFANYFGVSSSIFKSSVNYYYSNSSTTNYNSVLNGKTGVAIWIDQTGGQARIDSNTTIGSAAQPVILIVNGELRISGSSTVYGLVFVTGGAGIDVDTVGNSNVIGALVTTGSLALAGSAQINFNSTVLNATQQSLFYYAKVPGSWKDF